MLTTSSVRNEMSRTGVWVKAKTMGSSCWMHLSSFFLALYQMRVCFYRNNPALCSTSPDITRHRLASTLLRASVPLKTITQDFISNDGCFSWLHAIVRVIGVKIWSNCSALRFCASVRFKTIAQVFGSTHGCLSWLHAIVRVIDAKIWSNCNAFRFL